MTDDEKLLHGIPLSDEHLVKNLAWYGEEARLESAYPITHPMSKFIMAIAARERLKKREWVGLTDEERQEVVNKKWWDWEDAFDIESFARAIEAKLKEKNT